MHPISKLATQICLFPFDSCLLSWLSFSSGWTKYSCRRWSAAISHSSSAHYNEFFLDPLMLSPRFPKSTWDSGDENTAWAQFWLVHGKIPTIAIRIIFLSRNPLSKALPCKTNFPGQSPATVLVSVLAQWNGLWVQQGCLGRFAHIERWLSLLLWTVSECTD